MKPIGRKYNEIVLTAKMINKLYHARKYAFKGGINTLSKVSPADIKEKGKTKNPNELVNITINMREKINITPWDYFLYKYFRCGCYKCFAGKN